MGKFHLHLKEFENKQDFTIESSIDKFLDNTYGEQDKSENFERKILNEIYLKKSQMDALATFDELCTKIHSPKNVWTTLSGFFDKIIKEQNPFVKIAKKNSPECPFIEFLALRLREMIGNTALPQKEGGFSMHSTQIYFKEKDFGLTIEIEKPATNFLMRMFPSLKRKVFIVYPHSANDNWSIDVLRRDKIDGFYADWKYFLSYGLSDSDYSLYRFEIVTREIIKSSSEACCLDMIDFFSTKNCADFFKIEYDTKNNEELNFDSLDFWKKYIQNQSERFNVSRQNFSKAMSRLYFEDHFLLLKQLNLHKEMCFNAFEESEEKFGRLIRPLIWYLTTPGLTVITPAIFADCLFRSSMKKYFYLLLSIYLQIFKEENSILSILFGEIGIENIFKIRFPFLFHSSQSLQYQMNLAMKNEEQMKNEFFLY